MILPGPFEWVEIRLSDNAHLAGIEDTINFYTVRPTLMDMNEEIQSKISCLIEDMWTENVVRRWEEENAS